MKTTAKHVGSGPNSAMKFVRRSKSAMDSRPIFSVFAVSFLIGIIGFVSNGGQTASVANAAGISAITEVRNFVPNIEQKIIAVKAMNHTINESEKTWPVEGQVSALFGEKGPLWLSGVHSGLDIVNKPGTEILAAQSGVVTYAGEDSYYGKIIRIDNLNTGVATIYAHLEKILVSKNTFVNSGTIIGLMGQSGNTTGVHLHFEVIKDKELIDPFVWLSQNG